MDGVARRNLGVGEGFVELRRGLNALGGRGILIGLEDFAALEALPVFGFFIACDEEAASVLASDGVHELRHNTFLPARI